MILLTHIFTFLPTHILVKILVHNLCRCAILILLKLLLRSMVLYGVISACVGTKKEELGKVLLQLTIVPLYLWCVKNDVYIFEA